MARVKSVSSIDAEIAKTQEELAKLKERYDKTASKLEQLQEQKRSYEAKQIMDAFIKSGKSLDEVMTFLTLLWSSFFVTLVAKKIVLINLCYRPCSYGVR